MSACVLRAFADSRIADVTYSLDNRAFPGVLWSILNTCAAAFLEHD
jgi:hypothetical protein